MAATEKFTDAFIRNLQATGKVTDYREKGSNGFGVRVMPSGTKKFFYVYNMDGKRRFLNLGIYKDVDHKGGITLADANKKLTDAKSLVQKGIDPLMVKEAAKVERKLTPFVADFVDEFINLYAKEHNRGWREIERALKSEIVTRWGKRKLTDIKRRDLVLVLDEIKERGAPVMANRVMAYTRKMFSWAVSERAVLEINPFLMMARPSKEEARERSLSKSEIKTFWDNLDGCKMSDQIKRALKLILVTAQRPGEVIGMHRSEIEGDWWEIPATRSKNKRIHRVFLSATAKGLIGDAPGYIFESPVNSEKPYEVRTMTHDIKQNLPHTPNSKAVDRLKIPHFTPHDLRRTATGLMAESKIELEHRERVLNHKKGKLDGTYNQYEYADEKREALEELELKLNSIINDIPYRTRQQREEDKKAAVETDIAANEKWELEAQIRELQQQLHEAKNREATSTGNNVVSINQGRRKAA